MDRYTFNLLLTEYLAHTQEEASLHCLLNSASPVANSLPLIASSVTDRSKNKQALKQYYGALSPRSKTPSRPNYRHEQVS